MEDKGVDEKRKPRTPLTRRGFLKIFGLAALDLALKACGIGPGEYTGLPKDRPLMLKVKGAGGQHVPVRIVYTEGITALQLRTSNVKETKAGILYTPIVFKDRETTSRLLGELVGDELLELVRNPAVDHVGYYWTPLQTESFPGDRRSEIVDESVWGLPIITWPADRLRDPASKVPQEINERVASFAGPLQKTFGKGYIIGQITEVNGERQLIVLGYVHDARVLVEAPAIATK